jgi:hypothetical protein
MAMPSIGLIVLSIVVTGGVVFLLWVLYHFMQESSDTKTLNSITKRSVTFNEECLNRHGRRSILTICVISFLGCGTLFSQSTPTSNSEADSLQQKAMSLQHQLDEIQVKLQELKTLQSSLQSSTTLQTPTLRSVGEVSQPFPAKLTMHSLLPAASTLNVTLDGYYGYNFNHPTGRVNSLRAYDVLSNSFSINQAAILFELPTDVEEGRRYGMRVDLQFGQATATLQGNSANENRPDIYRNIFQAYGRYVVPVGKGLTVDFGKWASSLGFEANYTKDQLNYTRSYFAYYLPFYHAGIRANYPVNDKVAVNYWITNGIQQTEPFNSFKDQMVGLVVTPRKAITWNINYYLGQEHPDVAPSTNCGSAPLQPGLCFVPINPAPDGRTHIFDSYVNWQARPKLLLGLEGDYVISREWRNAVPGQSSAPSHVDGGAGYVQYQFNPRMSLAARAEYLSDRGGLFSGTTQALKETTGTYVFKLGDGFQAMAEYRRDWSNQNFFPRGTAGVKVDHQDTATIGLVWWYGGKEGAW